MQRADRNVIRDIILVRPYLYGWQDEIEKEEEIVIADLVTPVEKVVNKLIELDNRRIDLCNLKVLYGFIERGLGAKMPALIDCAKLGIDSPLFSAAEKSMGSAGYDVKRARTEFSYLFDRLPKTRKKKPVRVIQSMAAAINEVRA